MEDRNRRYACDRCRGHRLRCERGHGDTRTCKRCLKACAECITSPSLRTGRPRLIENATKTNDRRKGQAKSTIQEDTSRSAPALRFGPEILDQQENTMIDFWSQAQCPEYRPDNMSINLEPTALPSSGMSPDPYNHPLGIFDLFSPNKGKLPDVFNQTLFGNAGSSSQETGTPNGTHVWDYYSTKPITSSSPFGAQRQELLQSLSDLSASLLQDLKRVCDPAPDLAEDHIKSSISSSAAMRNFNVGRLIEQSERFIDILQHAVHTSSTDHTQSATLLASNTLSFDFDNPLNAPECGNDRFPSIISQPNCDGFSPSITSPLLDPPSFPQTTLIRLDVPTMFSVLSCYTSLLRIYEAVFSNIHASLRISDPTRQRLLPPLPGLHLCGFKLEKHQNLQIEILARISLQMLTRLEAMLDDISRAGMSSGMLEEYNAALLLNMVTKNGTDGGAGEGVTLTHISKSIRDLLDVRLGFP